MKIKIQHIKNRWYAGKARLREKFTALNYFRKEEKAQIEVLTSRKQKRKSKQKEGNKKN